MMFMQQQNQQYAAGSPDLPHMPYVNGQMRAEQQQNAKTPDQSNPNPALAQPEEQKELPPQKLNMQQRVNFYNN
jgi:hypothetical protein